MTEEATRMRRRGMRLNSRTRAGFLEGWVLNWILKIDKVGTRRHVIRSWEHSLYKVTASRENLARSRNFREFSMVEIQQVGKRVQETETGDGSWPYVPFPGNLRSLEHHNQKNLMIRFKNYISGTVISTFAYGISWNWTCSVSYRWGGQGLWRWSTLPKVTQLLSGRTGIWIQTFQSPNHDTG